MKCFPLKQHQNQLCTLFNKIYMNFQSCKVLFETPCIMCQVHITISIPMKCYLVFQPDGGVAVPHDAGQEEHSDLLEHEADGGVTAVLHLRRLHLLQQPSVRRHVDPLVADVL